MNFRELRADEIEVRVAMARSNGVSLLLYKDSRCDMRILDETVKPENWQKEFYECKGTLFCRVGIRVRREFKTTIAPYDEWIWKTDAGEPSNMSAQKGEASDAFKRACFNWGIGRELYTAPFIWINEKQARIKNQNGRYICNDKFKVSNIKYVDGKITFLEIVNTTSNMIVFRWGAK